jgi:hypothetical protein
VYEKFGSLDGGFGFGAGFDGGFVVCVEVLLL